MIPIGTTVYSFRDNPFVVIEGKVIGHRKDWHVCQWFDPILDQTYTETGFSPYLSKEEADKDHARICELLFRYRKSS